MAGQSVSLKGRFTRTVIAGDILPLMAAPATWTAIGTQIAVGFGLFYAVLKFFDTIGERLNEDTRLEIAIWLLGIRTEEKVKAWPTFFTAVLDRLFGYKKLSWRGFRRSWVATIVSIVISGILLELLLSPTTRNNASRLLPSVTISQWIVIVIFGIPTALILFTITNGIPDYFSFLKTRLALERFGETPVLFSRILIMVSDIVASLAIAVASNLIIASFNWSVLHLVSSMIPTVPDEYHLSLRSYMALKFRGDLDVETLGEISALSYPAFFGLLWFFLYAFSAFLLKAAHRFDFGFQWFILHMDIEKKPLQSIGLVAGAIVAVVYWTAVVVMRFV
jgi:hypothetical protein